MPPFTKIRNPPQINQSNKFSLIGVAMNLMVPQNIDEKSIINLRAVSEGNEEHFKNCFNLEAKCLT